MAFSKLAFMSRVIPEATDLTYAERVTLMAIAGATDVSGRNARISQEKLAEKCGHKNVRTAKRHTRTLLEKGYVIQQSRGNSRTHQSSVYRLKGTEPVDGETGQKRPGITGDTITPATATRQPATTPAANRTPLCRLCDKSIDADDAYNPPDSNFVWHRTCFENRYPTFTMKLEDCHL